MEKGTTGEVPAGCGPGVGAPLSGAPCAYGYSISILHEAKTFLSPYSSFLLARACARPPAPPFFFPPLSSAASEEVGRGGIYRRPEGIPLARSMFLSSFNVSLLNDQDRHPKCSTQKSKEGFRQAGREGGREGGRRRRTFAIRVCFYSFI